MTVDFADERDDPHLSAVEATDLLDLAASTMDGEGLPSDAEVSITLVDEAAMADLNQSHMATSGPTDVLAFPLETMTPGTVAMPSGDGPPLHIGDVFICPTVVARNAARSGVPFRDEMALMVVHGLLHLLGYDHVIDAEAEQMEQRERDLLARAGRVRP